MMTQEKARKTVVRARMAANGESYAEAARILAEQHDPLTGSYGGPISRPRAAVAVLFTDETDRVLLVRPPNTPNWNLPGRYVHPHECPSDASVVLAPEQLGVAPRIGHMLVVDWAPDPDDGFPDADKVTFVFDGGRFTPEHLAGLRPDPAEIAEYAFRAPEQITTQLLLPRLARRITAALAARGGGPNRFLALGIGGR
jgi:8-oxo-dGTP diphosphatase